MRTAGRLLLTVTLAAAGACMTAAAPTPANPQPNTVPTGDIAGVWNAVLRSTVAEGGGKATGKEARAGDVTVEHQEWHLAQQADVVSGYFIALQTVTSGDGRVFLCNRRSQYANLVRVAVSGRLHGTAVSLEETGFDVARGDCEPPQRTLLHWDGTLTGDSMTLLAADRRSTLLRESNVAGHTELELQAEAAFAASSSEVPPTAQSDQPSEAASASDDLTGTWVWEHQGPAPNGDEKQEREEWHLQQEGAHIHGYYDRLVRQVSTDGQAYRCSMALEFEILTRYRVVGDVLGDRVMIRERSFEILNPTPCDTGLRRLDSYEGNLRGNELRLLFGPGGRQTLRRARPDVPTQRF